MLLVPRSLRAWRVSVHGVRPEYPALMAISDIWCGILCLHSDQYDIQELVRAGYVGISVDVSGLAIRI
jgi:hypothetical protein